VRIIILPIAFFGRLPDAGTGFEIILDRLPKGRNDLFGISAVEADHIIDAGDPTNQQQIVRIELHGGAIALVAQQVHGLTPSVLRNSRTSRT
jgi:hypothetical protein